VEQHDVQAEPDAFDDSILQDNPVLMLMLQALSEPRKNWLNLCQSTPLT
jgi:hypothetical protein